LLANLFLENLIGNLVPGVAEDPKLLLLGKKVPKQVPRKRLPSRYPGRGSQARLSSSEPLASTVPKNGSQARSKEPFPSKVPSRNKARRNRFSSKRSQEELFPSKISRNNWEPLLANLFLGTLLENLFSNFA